MKKRPSRVVAIHSLTSFGRSSMAVIMPALSVMGVQCCPVPTSVLSTHTGRLGKPSVVSLADQVQNTLHHFQQLNLPMEAVYTGYLGNAQLIDICKEYFAHYKTALKVCDPVMGDDGHAYAGIGEDLIQQMADLCAAADVITPNQTEAAMLLGYTPRLLPLTRESAERWCQKLMDLCQRVVITGIICADGNRYNVVGENGQVTFLPIHYVQAGYPGTGDLFTAVVTGRLLKGDSLAQAVEFAADFVRDAIEITAQTGEDTRYGVCIELLMDRLTDKG